MALAIFTIGFLALAGLQVKYTRNNASARMMTESIVLADNTLSRLKALPSDHRDLNTAIAWHRPPAGSTGPYRVQWRIRADSPVKGTKTVSIIVSSQNRLFSRSVRLNTIIVD